MDIERTNITKLYNLTFLDQIDFNIKNKNPINENCTHKLLLISLTIRHADRLYIL